MKDTESNICQIAAIKDGRLVFPSATEPSVPGRIDFVENFIMNMVYLEG